MSCLTKERLCRGLAPTCAAAIGIVLSGSPAGAQQGRSPVRINELSSNIQETPRYEVSRTEGISSRGRSGKWFVVKVLYETSEDWVDELSVTFYLMVEDASQDSRSRRGGQGSGLVLRGKTTFVDIEKGTHQAVMAMQPSSLERYGDPSMIAVEISAGGQIVARASEPSARAPWWSQVPSRDGRLINRLSSPWAMLYFDEFEAIKGSTDGR